MAIVLFSQVETLRKQAKDFTDGKLPVLLTTGESVLTAPLQTVFDDLLVVDVQGPRLSRLNFDIVGLAIVDLTAKMLLSRGGRRLIDVLGRLASAPEPEDSLNLGFVGPAVAVTGAFLEDTVTAGLNLLPQTIVVPDVEAVGDLRTLLARLSETKLRLLALASPVSVRYEPGKDTVAVAGKGSALLAAFHQAAGQAQPTARLHALTAGMTSGWPT
ncbi:MAG: hypothetical protein U0350_07640 [Caldilineaceae bacterium]